MGRNASAADGTRSADQLAEWIDRDMRMSHVYQPGVLRALLDAGGVATVRQIAQSLLAADEAQIRWYEQRAKTMPLKVLRKHSIVTMDGDLVRLNVKALTFEKRARLRALCEQRIGEFLEQRGLATWDARLIETEPVPERLRYQILKRDRRCVLCGVGPKEARLEVDHIVPRSKGGSNELANLQTLCDGCNRGKSNLDDTSLVS
jgi:hypothetical protein